MIVVILFIMLDKCLKCTKLHCCVEGFAFIGIEDAKKI